MNKLISSEGDILPALEGTLIYFSSYLARKVKHSTIKLYLAAVRNLHISCGYGDPLLGKLLLKKVLRGILRYQGHTRVLRQPVTPRVLFAIRPILLAWLGERDFSMIWAAFTLAFFCFPLPHVWPAFSFLNLALVLGGYLLRRYLWQLSLAATSPSFVFANLALFYALYASSCPIQHVPAESARSTGEISMALKLSTL